MLVVIEADHGTVSLTVDQIEFDFALKENAIDLRFAFDGQQVRCI